METIDVIPIPALKDNYIWLLRRRGGVHCAVVDPGDAAPVLEYLRSANLQLTGILITHHHADHTAGTPGLKQAFPASRIYGPGREAAHLLEHRLEHGAKLRLPELEVEFEVLDIPGHTLGHIAYYSNAQSLLFCGDTLFSVGCGRLFEGTAEQMYASLQRLAGLPGETAVYCGHEYTVKNIAFATQVEPYNGALREYERQAMQLRHAQKPTLPTRLRDELAVNPFLRAHVADVKQSAERYSGEALADPVDVFRALRRWKDGF
jgi:hydroxyacylglutathione hydrolase